MADTSLQIAIQIPEATISNIDAYAEEHEDEATIRLKLVPEGELDLEDQLGFDPITGSAVVWLAVHILGSAAISIGMGLLTNAIYDFLKERATEGQMYEVRIQTSDGTSFSFRSDQPLDEDKLEEILSAALSD